DVGDWSGTRVRLARLDLADFTGSCKTGTSRTTRAGVPQTGGVKTRKLEAVAFGGAGTFWLTVRICRNGGEPFDTLRHVSAVAAGFGVFAVVDDVDAELDL